MMNAALNFKMRVISFCHYLQGPACTQYLADMGADVIKVEPLKGAFERHWSGGNSWVTDVSAFSLAVNRNKRSIAIDLKSPEGVELALALIADADVVVENYRPGVLDRLGIGYEAVRQINPAIIYASATGWGATGPAASLPGQDLLMQARSGLIAATGGDDPSVVGAAVVDQHGGSLLAMGILAAYVRRLQTGEGTRVESSLFSAAIDLQVEAITKYYAAPDRSTLLKRGRNVGSWYHDAPYGLYHLQDTCIVLSMNDPAKLALALESDELHALKDIDRYKERDRYASVVAGLLGNYTFAELSSRFDAHGIWYERVQTYEDLLLDPRVKHIGALQDVEVNGTTATLVAHPLRYDGQTPGMRTMPLYAGADSEEIMRELGISAARQAELINKSVVGVPRKAPVSDQNTVLIG